MPTSTEKLDIRWTGPNVGALLALTLVWSVVLAPAAGRSMPRAAAEGDSVDVAAELIDPNTATAASLRRLPMVGSAKAEAIVAYRHSRGTGPRAFQRPEDLQKVPGIGPGIVDRARPYMTFTE